MFDICKDLDVILITYNRKDKLKLILDDIFADNSPIKNNEITILDNSSTDGTSDMLSLYSEKNKNINHIRHNINIGGNANIVRAMERVSKKYFWILSDDDRLDWKYWVNIQNALESDEYDIIQVYSDTKVFSGESYLDKLAKLVVENVLLPAAIYRSDNINNDVIFNAYVNIYALIPHMSFISSIINKNKKIYFSNYKEKILEQGSSGEGYNRGVDLVHPVIKNMDLSVGFAITLSMINDKELVSKCIDRMRSYLGRTFQGFLMHDLPYNWIREGLNDNLMTIYDACNDRQKQSFIEILTEMNKSFVSADDKNMLYRNIIHDEKEYALINEKINWFDVTLYYSFSDEHKYIFNLLSIRFNKKKSIKLYPLFLIKRYKKYLIIYLFFFIRITFKCKKNYSKM